MKLIRLTTTDNNAIFDNNFNADINIPVDGKIALQNVSVESPNTTVEITPDNNRITYQTSSTDSKSILLRLGKYSDDNYQVLLDDIQDKLNDNTGFIFDNVSNPTNDRRDIGMEWRVQKDEKGKINIEYQLGAFKSTREASFRAEWVKGDNVRIVSSGNGECSLSAGLPNQSGVSANCFLRNFMAEGCGVFRCQINSMIDTGGIGKNGFVIGLTSKNMLNETNADFEVGDMTFGIACRNNGTGAFNFFTVEDGVETDSGFQANANDYIQLAINAGQVELQVFQPTSVDGLILEQLPYDGTQLFPFMVFNGNKAGASVKKVGFTESPYSNNPDLKLRTQPPNEEDLYAPPQVSRRPAPNFLQFNSSSLASFLGYNNLRNPSSGFLNVVQANYIADNLFRATILADAFLVLLDNIPLDSYDGFEINGQGGGARKNILSVVPVSNSTGSLLYEPSQPYFIDIKNRADLLLRQIKARIVLPDYSPLVMDGLATLTILVS